MFLDGAKSFGLWASGSSKAGDPAPSGPPGGRPPKPPRNNTLKKGLRKQTGGKISILGNKLTDLKVLKSKVTSAPLLLGYVVVMGEQLCILQQG